MKLEMTIISPGIIMVMRKSMNSGSRPLNLSLAKAKAAKIVVSKVPIVEKMATTMVLSM